MLLYAVITKYHTWVFYEQNKCFPHISAGWEVRDQSGHGFGVQGALFPGLFTGSLPTISKWKEL